MYAILILDARHNCCGLCDSICCQPSNNMRATLITLIAAFATFNHAQTHGEGEEGSSMGPVAFLWPPDRIWDAEHDNTAPCGSPLGPSNRTEYPLSQGAVALTIADDAWHVAFRLAVSNSKHTFTDLKPALYILNCHQTPQPKQTLMTRW